jgi:cell wall-associated NlpC family hydrolase
VAGIDCSGLVQLALRMTGHGNVPRDSGDQARSVGQELPLESLNEPAKLKRGDLIFWKGHVAMLLDASRIIHANATHMMVAIEPLKEALARIGRDGSEPVALRRP